MAGNARPRRRKARPRTELTEVDESRLTEAAALFGLPKAEVARRPIRVPVADGSRLRRAGGPVSAKDPGTVEVVG